MKSIAVLLRIITIVFIVYSGGISQTSFVVSHKTSGDTLLSIDNDGNLGIRVPEPEVPLHILMNSAGYWQHGIRIINPGLESGNQLMLTFGYQDAPNNAANVYFTYNGDASEQNRLTLGLHAVDDVLNILANGRVGIGTTNPSANLEMRGTDPDDGITFSIGNSDLSHQILMFPGRENDPNPFIRWKAGDPLRFSTDEGGWSEKMRIDAGGNVGIGTDSPSQLLEVAGTIRSTSGGFMFPDGSVQTTATVDGGSGNTLDEAYDQGGAGAGAVINADAGAVGISGSGGLWVNGYIEGYGNLGLSGGGTEGGQLSLFDGDGEGAWEMDNSGDTDVENLRFFRDKGFNDISNALVINNSGNVGIGTGRPSEKLSVTGTVQSMSGGFLFPDGSLQTTAATGSSGGNTLNQAYDEGGPGAGRTILADNGAVRIAGPDGLVVDTCLAIGTITPEYPLDIHPQNHIRGINIDHDYTGSVIAKSIYVDLDKTGTGSAQVYGGEFKITNDNGDRATSGVSASVDGTSTGSKIAIQGATHGNVAGSKYALYGYASGSDIKYGVYGTAIGSGINWAGYFASGNVYISNRLGIGTEDPQALIDVTGSAIFEGEYGSGTIPREGEGSRMMWYPAKAAFRAGLLTSGRSGAWDADSIGSYSTALGYNTRASGTLGCIAMGYGASALATTSTAIGFFTKADANYAMAFGNYTTASGQSSTAMGWSTVAEGGYSTAMGYGTRAEHSGSTAMGQETTAANSYAFAVGYRTTASGVSSIAMGRETAANGGYTTATGYNTTADAYCSTVIGRYNVGGGSTSSWITSEPVFEIGIGSSSSDRENALTVYKNGNLEVNGRVVTPVLEITGGSDLSEQFNVREAEEQIRSGLVVCINPDNPGELMMSTGAYDRKVAGIISGAGGIETGMLMGQNNSVADGQHPVALSGRVYCWVDASNGPIKPGDLLTTSEKPGHAMKVTDYSRAQGAILGKAMSPLKEGCGLVLVLVSLQ